MYSVNVSVNVVPLLKKKHLGNSMKGESLTLRNFKKCMYGYENEDGIKYLGNSMKGESHTLRNFKCMYGYENEELLEVWSTLLKTNYVEENIWLQREYIIKEK